MTMVLSLGMFITPALLGGRRDMMMANLVDFFTRETLDWNMAAAIAMVLTLISAALILMLLRLRRAEQLV
jgi:mannopine transport system permease protein